MFLEDTGCCQFYSFVEGDFCILNLISQNLVFYRQVKKAGFIALGYLNQLAILIGNSVLWPVAVILYDQLKAGYLIFHATAIQPIIDVIYVKYKYVEDLTYIHVLGPVCQKVIDNVPEKNPFVGKFYKVIEMTVTFG